MDTARQQAKNEKAAADKRKKEMLKGNNQSVDGFVILPWLDKKVGSGRKKAGQ